jgi:hypothetical protein
MKKFLTLALTFALLFALTTACDTPAPVFPEPTPTLSPELEAQIIDDFFVYMDEARPGYYEFYGHESTVVYQYFGNYSGCEAVFMREIFIPDDGIVFGYEDAMRRFTIAGYEFYFANHQPLYFYKDSKFLNIEEAYKSEWIHDDDVGEIWHQIYSQP